MSETNRDLAIDNLKGFLIFLVVLGHLLELGFVNSDAGNVLDRVIYSFHMPAFVFTMGMFAKTTSEHLTKNFQNYFSLYFMTMLVTWIFRICFKQQFYIINIFKPEYALWYLLGCIAWPVLLKPVLTFKHPFIFAYIVGILILCFPLTKLYLAITRIVTFFHFTF